MSMQNELNFMFQDKIGMDEALFFRLFLPHLSRPKEEISEAKTPFKAISFKYYRPKDILTVSLSEDFNKKFTSPSFWEIFYQHATFKEIIDSIDPTPWNELITKMDRFSNYDGNLSPNYDPTIHNLFSEEERAIMTGDPPPPKNTKVKLALQVIRDCPTKLFDKEFTNELIEILDTARYGLNKKERTEAINLLKDNLTPSRRLPCNPAKNKIVKTILLKLARHLSHKCKDFINTFRTLERGEHLDKDLYNKIIKWSSNNREFRISRLPLNELNCLVTSPPKYINNLILNYFKVKDLRTIHP